MAQDTKKNNFFLVQYATWVVPRRIRGISNDGKPQSEQTFFLSEIFSRFGALVHHQLKEPILSVTGTPRVPPHHFPLRLRCQEFPHEQCR